MPRGTHRNRTKNYRLVTFVSPAIPRGALYLS